MELKSSIDPAHADDFERSNRTFMELKFVLLIFKFLSQRVLIAPLWN